MTLVEYQEQMRLAAGILGELAVTEQSITLGYRVFESVQFDGNWFVAEGIDWQIAVRITDHEVRRWKRDRATPWVRV